MKKFLVFLYAIFIVFGMIGIVGTGFVYATATSVDVTTGGVSYVIGTPEPIPFTLIGNNYNVPVLYVWDEVQNFVLPGDLYVDRVFDDTADFIGSDSSGYYIKPGTIVSSHYVQWDPVSGSVQATLGFDSQIFAFITADQKLSDSDSWLGLSGINYGDFTARGLESNDITNFNGSNVDINWSASNPGDWTRLLTAYSPGGGEPPTGVPEPATMLLLGSGLIGLVGFRRKKLFKE